MPVGVRTTVAVAGLSAVVAVVVVVMRQAQPAGHPGGSATQHARSNELTVPPASAGSGPPDAAPSGTHRATHTAIAGIPAPSSSARVSAPPTATSPATRATRPSWRIIFHEDFAVNAAPGTFLAGYRNFGAYPWFMHHVGAPSEQDYFDAGAGFAKWHIATTEWSPNKVVFSFDGKIIGTSTMHVPAKPMHYVLQTETQLGSSPVPSTSAGNVQVDWVSIWRYQP